MNVLPALVGAGDTQISTTRTTYRGYAPTTRRDLLSSIASKTCLCHASGLKETRGSAWLSILRSMYSPNTRNCHSIGCSVIRMNAYNGAFVFDFTSLTNLKERGRSSCDVEAIVSVSVYAERPRASRTSCIHWRMSFVE